MTTHAGSYASQLLTYEAGERRYFETTLAASGAEMSRRLVPRSRRPEGLRGREFRASLHTAVAASNAADVRYLICIERIA